MQMVDMRGVDQPVHGGVDGRRRPTFAMQAVVEGGDHLVLALDARVPAGERAEPVEPPHGAAIRGEGAQVTAGSLHPQQLGGLAGSRASRSTARPAAGRGPRAPPEPGTHSNAAGAPGTGAGTAPGAEGWPPAE